MAGVDGLERVAMVMDYHPNSIGGVQSHVRDLVRTLKSMFGIESVIVSRELGKNEIRDLKVEGHYPVKPLLNLEVILTPPDPSSLKKVIAGLEPDLIHSHHIFTFTSLYALKVGYELGIPRIATNHTIFLGYTRKSLWRIMGVILPTRYFLRYADAIVSVSRAADSMVEAILEEPKPRFIVPNGVDTSKYRPLGREPEEPRILFLGRLVHRKGPHILIKAFSKVVREEPEAQLVIAGKGYMEPLLRVMIKRLGLEGKVSMVGVVPENLKPELYRSSSVVAVPSLYNESFGIVALEAMASGRPIVASNHGGLADVVVDGVTGRLVKPGSARELASALIELLQDRQLRARMGLEARRLAEKEYSWERVAEKLLKVYLAVTSGAR